MAINSTQEKKEKIRDFLNPCSLVLCSYSFPLHGILSILILKNILYPSIFLIFHEVGRRIAKMRRKTNICLSGAPLLMSVYQRSTVLCEAHRRYGHVARRGVVLERYLSLAVSVKTDIRIPVQRATIIGAGKVITFYEFSLIYSLITFLIPCGVDSSKKSSIIHCPCSLIRDKRTILASPL